jgi:hypothetical protein
MADAVQVEQNEPVAAAAPEQGEAAVAGFRVVPFSETASQEELYGFREAMAAAQPEPAKAPEKSKKSSLWLVIAVAVAAVVSIPLLFLATAKVIKPKPPVPYYDLGSWRFDPANLGGRLIVRWQGSATYQFFVDPLDPDQIPGFQAVAQDPPHLLSFTVRLRNSNGFVICQKEIIVPMAAQPAGGADHARALLPQTTSTGDTVQNVAGDQGQIGEIDFSGQLPCPLEAYQQIAAWDFSTNFPTIDDQSAWLKHENTLTASKKPHTSSNGGYGPYTLVKSLPSPIEGDDVIVSDNPSRGIVATSEGRAFLLGMNVLTDRALDWQSFPASVHFRCEKNAACAVTRLNSRTTVHARLLR